MHMSAETIGNSQASQHITAAISACYYETSTTTWGIGSNVGCLSSVVWFLPIDYKLVDKGIDNRALEYP
jgi:hypothetical protein